MTDEMTPAEFRCARQKLGLRIDEAATVFGTSYGSMRGIERQSNNRVHYCAAQIMRWLQAGYRPPEWPERLKCQQGDTE